MSVPARVRQTLRDRGLVEPGMTVLVACSGGPDSAALLRALGLVAPELGFSLAAASVNHGLRASAALDVEIARAQALALGIPFHSLHVQLAPGGSIQAQARTARYAALLALAAAQGMQRIATGHTRDDQAETVVLRLLRGACRRSLRCGPTA
jgi:tRNA(Ile)-lysidine synthase